MKTIKLYSAPEAIEECQRVLKAEGLTKYRVEIKRSRTFFGECRTGDGVIFLSPVGDRNIVHEDTIWHEVAHALTPFSNHDIEWARVAVRLGCRPALRDSYIPEGLHIERKSMHQRVLNKVIKEAEADPLLFVTRSYCGQRVWVNAEGSEVRLNDNDSDRCEYFYRLKLR